jgi:hypothetical protein
LALLCRTLFKKFPHLVLNIVFPFWTGSVGGTLVLAEGSSLVAVSTLQGPA